METFCGIGTYCTCAEPIDLEPTVSTLLRLYEKLAHSSYEKHCAILRLNSEALAPIFKLLETEDRKNIRLTCFKFKDSIDNHAGIHVNLDQRQIDDMREFSLPPPGASSIRLWSINSSKFLDFLLRRPNLTTSVNFAGQISLSAFTKVMSRCKNLKKISFTDRSHLYANIVPLTLNNLHVLDIGCPGYGIDYVGSTTIVPSLWLTYEILLRRLIAPNLKVLRIFFCCVEECSVLHQAMAQIFRFLAVHDKVQELCINLHHRYERFHFLETEVNYHRFRIEVPKKILRSMQFQRLDVDTIEPAFKVWDAVLPAQKCLRHIDILNRSRRWFYFSKIVTNNCATLKVVRFHNISPKRTKTVVLDAGVFEECQVLETLFLSRFENSTQEIVYGYQNENTDFPYLDKETSSKPEMKNLKKLPVTLKCLHIQGLVLSTNDLCEGLGKLKNLQLLELQLTGYHIPPFLQEGQHNTTGLECGLGVTRKVIQSVLQRCRKLDTLFIEEFENHWTTVKDTKFGSAIHKISDIAGDGYFSDGGYYGILVGPSIPTNSMRLTRSERMHLWGIRISQYCPKNRYNDDSDKKKNNFHQKSYSVKDLSDMEANPSNICSGNEGIDISNDEEGMEYLYENQVEPKSSTCLLEILDKENGKLEQIQKIVTAECMSPPVSAVKVRTENTMKMAQEYSDTLFSAIPNYHKASRLQMDPTDKFTSFFPRSKTVSRAQVHQTVSRKMQNSEKLLK